MLLTVVGRPRYVESSVSIHQIVLVQYTLHFFVGLHGVTQITYAVDFKRRVRGTVIDRHPRDVKQTAA